jgi:hypothetical protein
MAAQRESSVEESSEWAGISESGDDDMDFEVGPSSDEVFLPIWLFGREELGDERCWRRDEMVEIHMDGSANIVVFSSRVPSLLHKTTRRRMRARRHCISTRRRGRL